MNDDGTPVMVVWQQVLDQAQSLAVRLPEIGLNPDKLASLTLDELVGVLAFLKRSYAEQEE
tara:strand:+ start:199970 stop:200152 length:183 start_codon:yes stop_codon:yes gene_type:complete